MEPSTSELLAALREIKQAIYVTGLLIGALLFGIVLAAGQVMRKFRERQGYQNVYFDQQRAEFLLNAGHLDELLAYCESSYPNYPNDANIIWYQALAHYHNGDLAEAVKFFNKASKINPHYKESAYPYIQEIEGNVRHQDSEVNH